MRTTLVLPETIAGHVRSSLDIDVETGAVLWANPVHTTGGNLRLLAVGFWPVPEDAYVVRTPAELLVASHGFVPPLAEIEEAGAVPIWMHTHPTEGASARRSEMDVVVDQELSALFRTRTGSPYYGALIVSRQGGQIRFYWPRRRRSWTDVRGAPLVGWIGTALATKRGQRCRRDTS